MRPGCYELTYRLFYGVSGTKMHVVRSQLEKVERAFGKVQWTISKSHTCAVAWFKGDPVAFAMGCRKDKPEVEELNAINSIGDG